MFQASAFDFFFIPSLALQSEYRFSFRYETSLKNNCDHIFTNKPFTHYVTDKI